MTRSLTRLSLMFTAASLMTVGSLAAPAMAQQNNPGGGVQPPAPPADPGPLQRLGDRVRQGVDRAAEAVDETGERVGRAVDRVLPRERIATSELDVIAEDQGLRVRQVYPDSYASRLDLQPGDQIVALDGRPLASEAEFYDLWSTRATSYPPVVVLRNGQRVVLTRQAEIIDAPAPEGRPVLGVYLTDTALGPQVEQVVPGSAADRAGIVPGDYIVSVGNVKTDTEAQVTATVRQQPLGSPMLLTYQRRNHNTDVLVRFGGPRDGAPDVNVDTNVTVARPALPDAPPTPDMVELMRRLERLEAEVHELRGSVKVLTEQSAD